MASKVFTIESNQLYNNRFLEDLIQKNFDTVSWIDSTGFVDDNVFCFWSSKEKNEHYLIELKASGDLDNKKARAEKTALLEE